jgi:hypothetical protein
VLPPEQIGKGDRLFPPPVRGHTNVVLPDRDVPLGVIVRGKRS